MADVKKLAQQILERIKTPEQAIALKGEERAKYLDALDKVFGPKEQRATDMGFGPETWYHGTAEDFSAFDPEKLNKTITRNQFWVSDNPEVASDFAKGTGHNKKAKEYISLKEQNKDLIKRIEKQYPRWQGDDLPQRVIDFDKSIGEITEKEAQTLTSLQNQLSDLKESIFFRKKMIGAGENILPVKVRRETDKAIDASGKNWQDVKKMIGDDEVLVKNVQEDVRPAGKGESIAPVATSLGVKKPEQIRSVNAAFDPRFKDSPYLMSAVGGGPLPFQGSANPAQLVEKAYGTYSKGVSDVAKKIADKLHQTVSIPGTLTKEQKEEDPSRKVLEFATEMAIDPLNYVGPGEIKAVGKAAQAAKESSALKAIGKVLRGK